jgi:hydroxyacylglutathione hydrolase
MNKAIIKSLRLGDIMTNSYFVSNKDTKEVILFDPAAQADRISDYITENNLTPVAIMLTHGHFDHIGAVNELRTKYGIKVYAHKEEEEVLLLPAMNLSLMMGENLSLEADILLDDEQFLNIAGFNIKVIHTPGHTVGSCCYLFVDEDILISGDTMFYGSYGRTDFPGGSESSLMRSIKEKLLVLNDNTAVYPGHDSTTTIGDEKKWY